MVTTYETHYDRYKELTSTYKVLCLPSFPGYSMEKLKDYDVAIQFVGVGYAHQKYRVIKNEPNLPTKDLAILCDNGNLCFGYRVEGGCICVYTD